MEDIKAIDAAELISRVICSHIETGASVKVFGTGGVSYSQGIFYILFTDVSLTYKASFRLYILCA